MLQTLSPYLLRVSRSVDALRRVMLLVLAAFVPAVRTAETGVKRSYDIAAGDAASTLRKFVEQSGEQIIYVVPKVRGVKTNPVKGVYTAREVLDRIVANTLLVVAEDEKTGALTINRAAPPPVTPKSSPAPQTAAEELPKTTMKRKNLIAVVSGWIVLALGSTPLAHSADATLSTGTIEGRVFNPATGQFVNKAEIKVEGTDLVTYTETDGYYRIMSVPTSEYRLTVVYTGYVKASATVKVLPGQTASRDFELRQTEFRSDLELNKDAIRMSAYTVSSEREGYAKAIMDQRASLNAKNIITSDNFGEVPDGNVGEFLKNMPGIVVDYTAYLARAVRISGLDPQYTGVAIDGNSVAGAASGVFTDNSRQVDLESLSLSNVEAVEVNKTLTANLDASSPAGVINLRSKSAFDRKGRFISYQVSVLTNSYDINLGQTPGPAGRETHKVKPNLRFEYADVFFGNRLGIHLSTKHANLYSPKYIVGLGLAFADPKKPTLTSLGFREGGEFNEITSAGLNADFKATEKLTLSWRSSLGYVDLSNNHRLWTFSVSAANLDPASTLTNVIAKQGGTNTRLDGTDGRQHKISRTYSVSPRFRYKGDTFDLSGGIDFSNARTWYTEKGNFSQAITRLSNIGWTATRSSTESTDWNLAQTAGRPWDDPLSYNRDSAVANNMSLQPRHGENEKVSVNVGMKKDVALLFPIRLHAGIKSQGVDFSTATATRSWTYVGPTGVQTSAAAALPTEKTPFWYGRKTSDNVGSLNLQFPDRVALYQSFLSNPSYFAPNTVANFQGEFLGARRIEERIDSGYAMGETRWSKLRVQAGLRYERTKTISQIYETIPGARIASERPDLVGNTIPYLVYQYRNGRTTPRTGFYDNFFLSSGAKYEVSPNLNAQLAFSQSILRPSYSNLAGVIGVDDTNKIINIPNPDLEPETSTKYYAGFQYYFEPAGTLSAGAFILDLKNILESRGVLSQAEAGYSDQPEYNGYSFQSFLNGSGSKQNQGFEVEYNQQLVFLPSILSGLSVFATYTRVIGDKQRINVVNRAWSGGVGYRYRRLSFRVNGTWKAPRLSSGVNAPQSVWSSERLAFDLTTGYKLSTRVEVFASGRNITDEPFDVYQAYDGHTHILRNKNAFGANWTFGVKGSF